MAEQQAPGAPVGSVRRQWPPRLAETSLLVRLRASLQTSLTNAVENRRLFVLLPFSLIVGLTIYVLIPFEPELHLMVGGAVMAFAVIGLALWRRSLQWLRIGIQLAALWLGFCLLPLHATAFGTAMLFYPAYGEFEAQVDEVISTDEDVRRLIISDLTPLGESASIPIRRARLSVPAGLGLAPGDRIRGTLRFAPIPGPVLPGSYDGQFHSYFIGVGAYGAVTGEIARIAEGDTGNIARRIQAMRSFVAGRIDAALDGDTAAIGKAMVMGDQSAISDETRDIMAAAGLAHIYSISGLHLSIVAGGVFWLVRLALASVPLLIAWPIKKIAAVAGILSAFLYLLLAGGIDNVPAFRSTLMLALIFGAVLAGRRALTMRNVAIAAILIILIDPASVFRASFQLSFAAVVGLIGIYELPRSQKIPAQGWTHQVVALIATTAWTSVIAGIATLLFSAYHFQQTAPLGVIGNVLALPVVSLVIMPFGVLATLAMPLGLDAPVLAIMGWGIEQLVAIAHLVANWSDGLTGNPLLASWTLVLALGALAWFAFLETHWRLLLPAFAAAAILKFGFEPRPDILVADTTQAVAIRDGEEMALASGRTGSFAVDVWSQDYQVEIAPTHSGARCDTLGCIVTTPDYSVAIVRNAAALAEDCGRHNLLIARIRVPSFCAGSQVIDADDLERGGVHWLRWEASSGQFDIRAAMSGVVRPWRVTRP